MYNIYTVNIFLYSFIEKIYLLKENALTKHFDFINSSENLLYFINNRYLFVLMKNKLIDQNNC